MRPGPPKLLVGIVHAHMEPWSRISIQGQATTWLAQPDPPGVQTVYAHGSGASQRLQDIDSLHEQLRWNPPLGKVGIAALRVLDATLLYPWRSFIPKWHLTSRSHLPRECLHVEVPDLSVTTAMKELALMDYFLEQTDAVWLYMTTSSSYVRIVPLLERLEALGGENVYAGTRIGQGRRVFASGANRALSRDVVTEFVNSRRRWSRSLLEDLAMGDLMKTLGFALEPLPSINLASVASLRECSREELAESHHYRLKSGPLEARNDVAVMRALHERLLVEGLC